MVKMVSKCCFWFDLRFGYYTYAILTVALRLSIVSFSYLYAPIICSTDKETCAMFIASFGWYNGWLVGSILFCCLAIVGIIQERSIIIYPYIVTVITELVFTTISLLLSAIFVYSLFFLAVIAVLCISGYDLWCLISLYKKIKKVESTVYLLRNSNQDII